MRNVFHVWLLAAAACGGDDDAPAAWLGPDPHATLRGEIDGISLDLDVDGDVTCKREYVGGVLVEVEATIRVVEDGLEKEYELGLTNEDFAAMSPPAALDVVDPGDDALPVGSDVRVEVQWQWEDPEAGFVSYEGAATAGALELAELSGEPVGGIIPDDTGALGVWLDATWSGGHLTGSLTAPCGPNEVE